MRELEPELKEIREKYKDKKEEQAQQTMELYKQHGVSPFSGCIMLIIQLPILIALYQVFWKGLDLGGAGLYSFVAKPEFVRMEFLGLIDMGASSLLLAILVGLSQFIQMKLAQPPVKQPKKTGTKSFQDEFARAMRIQTTYILPAFIAFISYRFPAAVPLYWTTINIFATVHEGIVRIKAQKINSGQAKKIYGNTTKHQNQSESEHRQRQ